MNHKHEGDSFIHKVATVIVDKRSLFFLLYGFALVFCLFSRNWVSVENDVTTYLPEDTETRKGLVTMNDNFTTYASARVMVSNVPYGEAQTLLAQIEDVEGVDRVTFDAEHYRDASALYEVSFTGVLGDAVCEEAMEEIAEILQGRDVSYDTPVGYDENGRACQRDGYDSGDCGYYYSSGAHSDITGLRRGTGADAHLRYGGNPQHGYEFSVRKDQLYIQFRGSGASVGTGH